MSEYSAVKKAVVSLFIVVNLVAVAYMQQPIVRRPAQGDRPGTDRYAVMEGLAGLLSPEQAWIVQHGDMPIRLYAYFLGFDTRWQMFTRLGRTNWWYVIKANYSDGERTETVVLPLALQSEQTLVEQLLWDFKEVKFHWHLERSRVGRLLYGRYLARQYPQHEGLPIKAIIFEFHTQKILQPHDAAANRTHLESESRMVMQDRIAAPRRKQAAAQ